MERMSTKASIMDSLFPSLSSSLVCVVVLLLLVEQIRYLRKKRGVPGPTMVVPFLGNAVALVWDPTGFWDAQSATAKSSGLGFCADYVVGRFILFIHDTELSHKVFANVRPDAFALIGHPFGKKLFGEHNLIYMTGQEHKDLRRRMVPNFTPRALTAYTALQQVVILDHLKNWFRLSEASPSSSIPLRWLVRDMNLETSQTVFVGPYLAPESRERFKSDYNYFNVGLMKLPIDFPGTAFRNARLAVNRLIETLTVCAEKSRKKMTASEAVSEPTCLVDFWVQENAKEAAAAEAAGLPAPENVADSDLGSYLFDFLFAAQDASTSSLLWAVALLDAHPEVLRRVREEVAAAWTGEGPISAETLAGLRYTHAVAREVVRLRAPATLVPHIAAEEFPLTEDYTIPKGTIVFPSTFESCLQGFTESERFDPERFSEERQEDRVYKRNFLAFGAGAHQCVGQRYAMNHLVLFIAMFTALVDFERVRTDGCDEIVYVPTICPKDDCRVTLRRRCTRFPSF